MPDGIESSCTAAISDQGAWLRIFPVPWRLLPTEQQFRKYQWIEVNLIKAKGDSRAESFNLRQNGIKVLTPPLPTGNWQARKEIVLPLRERSLCALIKKRNADYRPTLGLFRPSSVTRFRIVPAEKQWSQSQLDMLRQQSLFVEGGT